MDKYEYKVRADEIKELIAQGDYVQAAEIADTIDWRRVKSVMMLCTISDLYKKNRRYEDAKNMLLLAYDRKPGGRTICYSLCELCIKTEEFVSAVNYYKEYVQAAPKDSGRYILQYKLYEAQDVSLEERIGVLEELKKRDYREKWAYELAYLYHRVGLATRCVEECDELILWFGEGKYVVKAMELKMLHEPLTPSQQQKYDHRFDEPVQEQEETEVQEDGSWNASGQNQGESQWSGYDQPQGESQWSGYDQPQGESQWNGYDQPQGESQWSGYDQNQGEGQWNGYDQNQGEGQWNGYDQNQGEGQWNGYDQNQGEGQWNGYDQNQGEGQWNGYDRNQGGGQWNGYDQNQEDSDQPQTESRWAADGQVQSREQWGDYESSEECGDSSGESYASDAEEAAVSASAEDLDIQVKTMDVSQYNTINLQAELAAGLQEVLGEAEQEAEDKLQEAEEKLPDASGAAGLEDNGAKAVNMMESAEAFSDRREGVDNAESVISTEALVQGERPRDIMESDSSGQGEQLWKAEAVPEGEYPAAEGQENKESMPLEDSSDVRQVPVDNEDFAIMQTEQDIVRDDTAEMVLAQMRLENAREKQGAVSKGIVRERPQKTEGRNSITVPEGMMVEKQITGQMKIEDILAEWEQTKRENEEKYKEEIRQDILRQTGPMFTEFEAAARDGLLERLEKGEAVETEEVMLPGETVSGKNSENQALPGKLIQMDEFRRSSGRTKKESLGEVSGNTGQTENSSDDGDEGRESEQLAQEYPAGRMEDVQELTQGNERYKIRNSKETQAETHEIGRMEPELPETEGMKELLPGAEGMEAHLPEPEDQVMDFPEAERMEPELPEAEGTEPEDAEMDFPEAEGIEPELPETEGMEAELPETEGIEPELPETEGMEAELPEAVRMEPELPQPEDTELEFSEAGEKAEVKEGVIARTTAEEAEEPSQEETARDNVVERDKAKVRGLTREEKELYAPFIQSRSAREKLVQAIDNISMAAYTGNIVITGEEGMDTLTFAKNMIREVQITDSNFSGKVAKISGESLNGRDVNETLWNLNNGALIIYRASGMEAKTAAMLHKALQQENLGIIIVLEDTKKAMQRMFLGTPELYGDFTARMDLEALSNDTLVAFGKRYAREMEYSIDNLGVLALHTRIEELQTIDHVVTVVEVKKIVDEAIRHACRKTLGHFFDILFSKRYDEEDMIILTEKDFAY